MVDEEGVFRPFSPAGEPCLLPSVFGDASPCLAAWLRLNRDIKGTRTVKPAQAGINAMASIGKRRMNASPQVSKLSPLRSPSEERQLLVQVFKGYGPNEGQMPG
ncbi:unnamed protein product [Gadus morhua 'NCC']